MAAIDHLVLATPDLASTVAEVAALTGTEPVPGGAHPGLGTRNHLLGLGEGAYLEIVGPDPEQPEPERPRPFGIDGLTESRIVTWAVRVENLDAACAGSREAGYDPGEAWSMSRRTPAGGELQWRLTLDRERGHRGLIPFLIDWGRAAHPSANLPTVPLVSLEAIHPDPGSIEVPLKAIGTHLLIKPGNRQALQATLFGETGLVVLH
ncbi:VOC family protein [Glycomyces buryatensis]|uniref:VOC family protein n=1 Tax=Glycomyces buryatensis TaxID=2570927 RepID=A0A4S8Q9H5_9ACTN|nr:VOC family protein [Glycomyces buryatensis]THV36994.1 VOC family protein [Glycomyces buryatensis]